MLLTDFLLARIAEDEADVDPAYDEVWIGLKDRVLAECETKRRIVGNATNMHTSSPEWDEAVRLLATVYADHPDYDEAWRP